MVDMLPFGIPYFCRTERILKLRDSVSGRGQQASSTTLPQTPTTTEPATKTDRETRRTQAGSTVDARHMSREQNLHRPLLASCQQSPYRTPIDF